MNVTSGITFDRTVHFVVFSGEEQGIYGSAYYVDQALKDKNNKITNALLMDMISYSSRYFGVTVGTLNKKVNKCRCLIFFFFKKKREQKIMKNYLLLCHTIWKV